MTTWTLEMLQPPHGVVRELSPGTRIERAGGMTPEYARFLYGLVGGPWFWIDRLPWTRQAWESEIAAIGTEFLVAYGDGVPLGFIQIQPAGIEESSHAEIRYFGLVESAIGRGLGAALLEQGIAAAWTLHERHEIGVVRRVWVHTCSLDGPAALANYQARGLRICGEAVTEEDVPGSPLGAWRSSVGGHLDI
ncbi:GNAT family N-acetyltransferase [Leekyejoonella antrihumi]|uniref:GNAT family N-acetyltransferase n=1 Tax=Leekyejoonella antrihumi TaxID=1660198 RepID=A0A563E793_9MICO|nr:GNAT family N-acetyltransferase [Leekyejoonella antrihumi]TWP37704.1 GNAT family N-acetyltransferase [Leekyejoonella antrihumi]